MDSAREMKLIAKAENYGVKELENMIGLAEKISDNLSNLNQKAYEIKRILILGFLLTVLFLIVIISLYNNNGDFQFLEKKHLMILFSFMACLPIYISYEIISKRRKIKKDIEDESEILFRLYNIIHGQKESVSSKLSILNDAIIDMRLQRIKYSLMKLKKENKQLPYEITYTKNPTPVPS